VVLVAGGIGATPAMAALRDIIQNSQTKYPHIRKVVFAWCVKKVSVTKLYNDELAYYQQHLHSLASGCQLKIIVHATLSEEENPEEIMDNVPSTNPSSRAPLLLNEEEIRSSQRTVTLEMRRLVLLLVASCSFFLGIFLSRVATTNKELSNEPSTLLQLLLPTLLTIITVFFVLRAFSCHLTLTGISNKVDQIDKSKCLDSTQDSSSWDSEEPRSADLDMVVGRRPEVEKLFKKLHKLCIKHDFKSVGVSVCGPTLLVDNVFEASKRCSTKDVKFVVDEETFDW
jgi:hypothetical protein